MSKDNGDISSLAEMFRTLGDGTRLRILMQLQDGEMNVTQICQQLDMPQPNVSRHLGILRTGGLVSNRRDGKEVFYSINDLQKARYPKALQRMLKDSAGLRMGPVLVGLARNGKSRKN